MSEEGQLLDKKSLRAVTGKTADWIMSLLDKIDAISTSWAIERAIEIYAKGHYAASHKLRSPNSLSTISSLMLHKRAIGRLSLAATKTPEGWEHPALMIEGLSA